MARSVQVFKKLTNNPDQLDLPQMLSLIFRKSICILTFDGGKQNESHFEAESSHFLYVHRDSLNFHKGNPLLFFEGFSAFAPVFPEKDVY